MKKGTIIFLNGVSSAGKTTLSKLVQQKSPEAYFYIAQDIFTHMITPNFRSKYDGEYISTLWRQAVSAMHHTIKLYSDLGHCVIVDHVLTNWQNPDGTSENTLEECVTLLHDSPVLFIKVTCPLEELQRREKNRSDRSEGTAQWQLPYLVPQETYDLVVDTHAESPEQCAETILAYAKQPENFKAFQTLYNRYVITN